MQNLLKELFESNVIHHSNRTAIESGDVLLNYNEFAVLVQSVEKLILESGIRNKAIIVLNDYHVYTYACILAINFSGNTVLPVDPKWPYKRLTDIIKRVKPAGIVLSVSDKDGFNGFDEIIELCDLHELCILNISNCSFINKSYSLSKSSDYKDIIYIISTSGSTGIPKGVPIKQESINAFIQYFHEEFDFNENDRFLQVFDITFDVAYFSFFIPLCFGACCCIVTQNKGLPKYLSIIDDLRTRDITVVSMVSTVLHFVKRYLRQTQVFSLRYSILTGDVLYHSEALEWQWFVPNSVIYNFYGPSEITIFCSKYVWKEERSVKESKNDLVPIGLPFPEMNYEIIDEDNKPVNKGQEGELAISSIQVIDAYIGEEHQEKFYTKVVNDQVLKYYKTGDCVSINERGNLYLHGRKDHQVKINGYRIELEEVQNAVQQVADRKTVVLKVQHDHVFYMRAVIEGEEQDVKELRKKLTEFLPEYMVPTEFLFIPELPVNENGKLNIKALQSI